jgi:glycosidase
LENHDEQRIPSTDFAGSAEKGKPAMVVSATLNTAPTMIYFGQEVGEPGAENAGFGSPTRTSIFDYVGVPHLQRWVNNKKFDGGQLSESEKNLRDFYKRLLNVTINNSALMGAYKEIHMFNREHTENYDHRVFSFVRWSDDEKLIIVSNFDQDKNYEFDLKIPKDVIDEWDLDKGSVKLSDLLYEKISSELIMDDGMGVVKVKLDPLESLILSVKE